MLYGKLFSDTESTGKQSRISTHREPMKGSLDSLLQNPKDKIQEEEIP